MLCHCVSSEKIWIAPCTLYCVFPSICASLPHFHCIWVLITTNLLHHKISMNPVYFVSRGVNRRSINVMRSFLAIDPLPMQPHSHFEAKWKSTTEKQELKKESLPLSFSVSLYVLFLTSKLFLLLFYRMFICFCFVTKAHPEAKMNMKTSA